MDSYFTDDDKAEPLTPKNAEQDEPEDSESAYSADMDDKELIERAMECYRLGVDTSAVWRAAALEDLNFLAGDQWDTNIKAIRDMQRRPVLTVNRLPQFVQQVTNEQRQSKPSVTVSPVDFQGDTKTAEVLQGIIRNIEYTSNASVAYSTGGQSAARTGVGYWHVEAEYENERSFEQKLSIKRIRNPLAVVMDPASKEIAGDDARWVIVSTDISKAEWDAMRPDEDPPSPGNWSGLGDNAADWVIKDGVRIHEYRWIAEQQDALFDLSEASDALKAALKLAKIDLSTGAVLASHVGPDFAAKLKEAGLSSRETVSRKACFAKIAGDEVIERGELAGQYLQVVRVVGTEIEIDGRVIYEGVVRHAKDTQRALNYFVSAETEAIALVPKAPWLVAEGQIEGFENQWENANQKPQAVLTYRVKANAPPPTRIMAEANIQAITAARQGAAEDLSEVTGIYPTQFGAPSPEQSGRAILARQTQGQVSNFHFQDNFAEAIKYTGRILIDLIPKIYSGPRIMRILGEDGVTPEMVPVNGHPGEFRGKPSSIQLDAGRYDVAVSMGPSYLSRRQEAAQQMLELVKVNPQIGGVISDLLVRALDIPNGNEIADRLQKMLPPQIRPPDDEQPPQQVLAQQIQQQGALIEQMTRRLHELSHILETEEIAHKSKERIALINAQTELVKTAATLNAKEAQAMLDRTQEYILTRMEIDNQPDDSDEDSPPQSQPQGAPSNGRPGASPGAPGITGGITTGSPGAGAIGGPTGGPAPG